MIRTRCEDGWAVTDVEVPVHDTVELGKGCRVDEERRHKFHFPLQIGVLGKLGSPSIGDVILSESARLAGKSGNERFPVPLQVVRA